jgi:hypothetical protein
MIIHPCSTVVSIETSVTSMLGQKFCFIAVVSYVYEIIVEHFHRDGVGFVVEYSFLT